MRLLLGLDYELFFGRPAGTVEACLIEPTAALLAAADALGIKISLFVDAGYLCRLRAEQARYPRLSADYSAIAHQLADASARGHDVQLHVHPHWEDSHFDGEHWRIDVGRYRLHDFEPAAREEIVRRYRDQLAELAVAPVFAYRAGGWCLEPFAEIAGALRAAGVWLDSTVFAGGFNTDRERGFDFRGMEVNDAWRFELEPREPCDDGYFMEIPISAAATGPWLYWRMALARLTRAARHRAFGDGRPLEHEGGYYLSRLLRGASGPASLDGFKASYMARLLRRTPRDGLLNVMGHPKSLTRYSLECLRRALEGRRDVEPHTFQSFANEAPAAPRAGV